MKLISIVSDYTKFPGGRYTRHGKGSGEEFRQKFMLPVLRGGEDLTVDLDGAAGYPASFLEEAFGGLIRAGLSPEIVKKHLTIEATQEAYKAYVVVAWEYIDDAIKNKVNAN
jgi:hypothetical protein